MQPTPVFLPRESCEQRSLVGCCPWGCTESDTAEVTQLACMPWKRKWQPTPVFLPGESQGHRRLVGYCLWGHTESDTTEGTQQQQQQQGCIKLVLCPLFMNNTANEKLGRDENQLIDCEMGNSNVKVRGCLSRLISVLVHLGCQNKIPQIGWLINSRNLFLTV